MLFAEVYYKNKKKRTICQNVMSTKTNVSPSVFLKNLA